MTARHPGVRSRIRALAGFSTAAAVLAAVAACASPTPEPSTTDEFPTENITVAVSNAAIEHTPVYIAVEQGLFAEYGLSAKIVALPTGVEIANSVTSGDADFGVIGGVPTIKTAAAGVPLKVIAIDHGDATATAYSPFQGIVAGPDTGIGEGDIEALRGRTIGVPLGSGGVPYLYGILASAGLTPEDVNIVNVAPADALVALQQGDVDAVCLFQPFPSRAPIELPGATVVVNGDSTDWYDPGPIIAMEETVNDREEVTVRFLTAIAEAEQWLRANRDDAAVIATHWITGLDEEVAQEALKHSNYDMRLSVNVIAGWTDTTIPFLVATDQLEAGFDPTTMIAAGPLYRVITEHPELFSDLPEVADEDLLR